MRTVKLQVQVSVDGFAGGPGGELDWMTWNWDPALLQYVTDLTDSVDTMLGGRVLIEGFAPHWEGIQEDDPQYGFAQKMVGLKKVVFSRTQTSFGWENTEHAKGTMEETVGQLKQQPGKDIIVYGGASTVGQLIAKGLIDELYLFVNPTAIGKGLPIFNQVEGKLGLTLIECKAFGCGIVVLKYGPAAA